MDISIKRSYDPAEIATVFTHPDIWATIAEDSKSPDTFYPDLDNEIFMGVYVGIELIGFYAFRVVNSCELDIHAQILPKHRKKHALASGKAILKWFHDHAPDRFQKLTAQVPFKYPNVKDFCIAVGLQIEGVNRQSYRKGGEIYDKWHLGITRDEVKDELGK
ncbi:putative head assembly protein [Pseudoalteromonas virus vB_PspP-H6/1]|nr:putative head assembly protein [Pseudoalteromonas virus vB_PspP-H6/1]